MPAAVQDVARHRQLVNLTFCAVDRALDRTALFVALLVEARDVVRRALWRVAADEADLARRKRAGELLGASSWRRSTIGAFELTVRNLAAGEGRKRTTAALERQATAVEDSVTVVDGADGSARSEAGRRGRGVGRAGRCAGLDRR